MKIPVEPGHAVRADSTLATVPGSGEKGFCIVDEASASERFARRAGAIADAAEDRSHLRDSVPFGLKRRVVLRVPVFGDAEVRGAGAARAGGEDTSGRELYRARRLLARVALDLVAEVMKINHYFAEAGLLGAPEPARTGERTDRRL